VRCLRSGWSVRSNKQAGSVEVGRQGGHVAEMQRRRLLLAFGEVASTSGLEAATVGRVCEQAAVSRRTFYELFSDREDCLLAAFDQAIARFGRRVQPAFQAKGLWRERIRGALALLLERLDAEPDIARLCIVEASRGGRELSERRRRVLESVAAAVDEGRAQARSGVGPPPLTAQGVVGGVFSVIHTRLIESSPSAIASSVNGHAKPTGATSALVDLTNPLMAMIVHPYLGPAAAQKELERSMPLAPRDSRRSGADPFKGLPIRFTYRTARVLDTIASKPGASNRHIADTSGIADEGQMSRLLRRLENCELIENQGEGHAKGEPNAWTLTERGQAIQTAIAVQEPAA
jgi:AcrR family transcriptional regulator/DNA-binding MarR family transcriptional regulator